MFVANGFFLSRVTVDGLIKVLNWSNQTTSLSTLFALQLISANIKYWKTNLLQHHHKPITRSNTRKKNKMEKALYKIPGKKTQSPAAGGEARRESGTKTQLICGHNAPTNENP